MMTGRGFKDSITFAYEAVADSRDTIRAIDFKANALLVMLAIAGTNLDKIAVAERFLLSHSQGALHVILLCVGLAGILSGAVSIILIALILIARNSPASSIEGAQVAKGMFFGQDSFKGGKRASLQQHVASMTLSEESIHRELCFEHLKLVGIREKKAAKLTAAIITGLLGFVTLSAIFVIAALLGCCSAGAV